MNRAFDPATFLATMAGARHNGLVGLEYVAHGDDWCELALPYRPEIVGDAATGFVATGPIISLMDMAASVSTWLKSRDLRPRATLDLRVDYLRPAEPGKTIIGRGECYKQTGSIAFVRGEAHDGDPLRPVAHVTGTYIYTDV